MGTAPKSATNSEFLRSSGFARVFFKPADGGATWLHKATREMPKDEFPQAVERELTGKECEPHEIIYFKLYRARFR